MIAGPQSLRWFACSGFVREGNYITEVELQDCKGTQNFKYYKLTSDSPFLDKHLKLKLFGVLRLIDIIVSLKSLLKETRMSTEANMPNSLSLMVEIFPIFEVHFFVFKEITSDNSVLMYG